jgi:hypothetical protein
MRLPSRNFVATVLLEALTYGDKLRQAAEKIPPNRANLGERKAKIKQYHRFPQQGELRGEKNKNKVVPFGRLATPS